MSKDKQIEPNYDVSELFPIFAVDDYDLPPEEMKSVVPCVAVHLDDCDCGQCITQRGNLISGSTIFMEVKSPYGMKCIRLTTEEARDLANDLRRYARLSESMCTVDSKDLA